MADFGVDISKFDGDVSITKLKNAGVKFVIARVGGADDLKVGKYKDSKWDQNYANCKAAGMPIGAYYLLGGTTEAEARAEAKHCKQLLGDVKLEYPVYLDMEGNVHKSMGESARRKVVQAWVDEMGSGWLCGCYTWSWLMPSGVKNCEIWTCSWGTKRPSNNCGMWQFGGDDTNYLRSHVVAGYQKMDQNYCYVDYPALIKSKGLNGYAKQSNGKETKVASLRDKVVAKAESQLGVRYWTMHTGPKGSGSEGFGCAMLVCWCLNQVLGTDYYGSCWNLWGDAIGAPQYNQGGGEFEEVSEKDAQPGDAVIYFKSGAALGYSTSASHAALYVGHGQIIGSWGTGTPGEAGYMAGGSVRRGSVASQSLGGAYRFIRCKRLKGSTATTPASTATASTGGGSYKLFRASATVKVKSTTLNVRDKPSTKFGAIKAQYKKNDKVQLDNIVLGDDGYVWGSYIGGSGNRRYIALGTMELASGTGDSVTVKSTTLNVRDKPSTKTGKVKAQYSKGGKVNIEGLCVGDDGYVWAYYTGASSGQRRYIALGTAELAS